MKTCPLKINTENVLLLLTADTVYAMKCLTVLVFKRKPFVFIQLPSCSVNFHKDSTPHKSLPTPDLWRKP